MLAIHKLVPRGAGLAPVLLKRAATAELDWDVRQKSRFDATDSQGRTLGVFLPRGQVVRGGDVLVAEDGSLIVVKAAPQPVLEVQPDHLKLEPDHVLADMLRQRHLIVTETSSAFEPEGGAYATTGAHAHGHDYAQEHSHDHDHDHEDDHGHEHHDHGPGHGGHRH